MPDETVDLDSVTATVTEIFLKEGTALYERYGKQALEADQEFLKSLAEDAAGYTYKLGLAKIAGDENLVARHKLNLEFVQATVATRLAVRNVQLDGETHVALESLLKSLIGLLGEVLPVLLKKWL